MQASHGRCQGGSWWCSKAGRPRSAVATAREAGRLTGMVRTFSTTTTSTPWQAATTSTAARSGSGSSPGWTVSHGTVTSASPSPATVRTSNPSSANARAHDAATTDTPSGRPRRNDTTAAVGMRRSRVTSAAVPEAFETLLYEVTDHVATLTINRPERRNALSWTVMTELRLALAQLKADPEARVVVITGAGDKAFSAGADLSGMAAGAGFVELHDARGEMTRLFRELWELGKPTIARVRGYALAGGFGLALACDIVIAADDAQFGTPEIDVGLWPMMITVPMVRSMPPKKALELQMTGRRVRRRRGACRSGSSTRWCRSTSSTRRWLAWPRVLASKSPAVMKLGRDAFYAMLDQSGEEALRLLHGGPVAGDPDRGRDRGDPRLPGEARTGSGEGR